MSRVLTAAVAVAAIAWLGLMERAERLQASGVAATARQDFAGAEAKFRAAGLLNPDATPDMSLAYVHDARGRSREAIAMLGEVVRREPENRAAWGLLRGIAGGRDAAAVRRAEAALRRLDPLNARSRRARRGPRPARARGP